MLKGVIEGEYPVVYEPPKPKKIIPTSEDLFKFDKFGMGSIIGQITNKGASAYALLPILKEKYGEYSEEYELTLCRLKQSCKAQSAQIDRTKIGQEVKGIPKCWIVKATEDDEYHSANFYNKILLNKRPYFFKYLYRDSKREYNEYREKQETLCIRLFGKPLDTVLHSLSLTEQEQKFVEDYYDWCPLIISDSCMNMLCKYIESIDFDLKDKIKTTEHFADYDLYKNKDIKYAPEEKCLALNALQEYKLLKSKEQINKNNSAIYLEDKETFKTVSVNLEEIALENLNNVEILTNIYVDYFYKENPKSNKDILWKYFGKNIFKNILKNTTDPIMFPLKDINGDINYLGENYSLKEIVFSE